MVRLIFSAAALLALAACNASTSAAPESATEATSADTHAAHNAPAPDPTGQAIMDQQMKVADAADDKSSLITSDGYTFHTSPGKMEIVRLPQDGKGMWSAHGYAEKDIFRMLGSRDEPVSGGMIHAVRFEMLESGNGKVVFEKRATTNPADPVTQVLSVNFMVH
ncbi:unnamed protein product [Phaeothamnion confervicola]